MTPTTIDTDEDNALVQLFKRRQHNARMRCLWAIADGLEAIAVGDGKTAAECFAAAEDERALADDYGPEIEAARLPP